MSALNVLVTCAGRRHYLIEYFKDALGDNGSVIGADMDPTAPALAACHRRHVVPAINSVDYLSRIKAIIREESVQLVFSVNDLELLLFSEHRSEIETETGATLFVPPRETARVCADKWLTASFAIANGVNTPRSFLTVASACDAVTRQVARYPLIVKPRWGSGSIGLFRVEDEAELREAYSACTRRVEQSSLPAFGTDSAVLVQELVEGPEYGVDVLYGRDGAAIGYTAKRKLAMRAGETDKAVTVSPEPFKRAVGLISELLPHRGNLDCDFLERDGELYLLELNPRFGGGYPFTHSAGANHVAILVNEALGNPNTEYGYKVGRTFAKCDTLVSVGSAL